MTNRFYKFIIKLGFMANAKEKFNNFVRKHARLCEIIRFLIVGGLATLVDMFVMGLIVYAFDPSLYPKFYNIWYGGGEPSTVATVVGTGAGFIAGLIVNYVLSIIFVFEHKGNSKSVGGFLAFTLLSAVGLGIHLLGMYLGNGVWGLNEWIVKIVLTIIVLIYNYVSKRLLLFREKKTDEPEKMSVLSKADCVTAKKIMDGERMKISIVVPCYNEEECVKKYYEAVEETRKKLPCDFEYVFVDDGSRDRTLEIIREISSNDTSVRYVSFSRNFGKEAAILAGLREASGDIVGLMDVDLQDPPEMLIDMYEGIVNEGYDCVSCRRSDRKGESKIRSAFARTFYKIINRVGEAEVVDGARDYRLMTRKMTDAVLSLSERDRFSKGIFGWVGFKTKWLEYHNIERSAGKTKWSFRKLTKYALGGIEDFSTAPLKFNIVMSILTFLTALGLSITDIVFASIGHAIADYMVVLPVVFALASFMFAGVWIVSEYVKKIFREVKGRPEYIVRETERDNPGAMIEYVNLKEAADKEPKSESEDKEDEKGKAFVD